MNILDKFKIDNKVAIITGASGLLGKKFSHGLAEAGAKVALIDIDISKADALANEIGDNARAFSCDVSDADSVRNCIENIIKVFGKIDILHNNAATKTSNLKEFFEPFETYSLETWREVMSVNIDGMFLMAQAVGPHMIEAGGGTIIQTSSIYGEVGPDNRIYEDSYYLENQINTPAVYSASKAAVIGLTRWLATYWAKDGIRVNCLVPGGVKTGQNDKFVNSYSSRVPMARMSESHELVPALLYLASDASSYVTGQVMNVDGGWNAW